MCCDAVTGRVVLCRGAARLGKQAGDIMWTATGVQSASLQHEAQQTADAVLNADAPTPQHTCPSPLPAAGPRRPHTYAHAAAARQEPACDRQCCCSREDRTAGLQVSHGAGPLTVHHCVRRQAENHSHSRCVSTCTSRMLCAMNAWSHHARRDTRRTCTMQACMYMDATVMSACTDGQLPASQTCHSIVMPASPTDAGCSPVAVSQPAHKAIRLSCCMWFLHRRAGWPSMVQAPERLRAARDLRQPCQPLLRATLRL
jgi:hypothetical protein